MHKKCIRYAKEMQNKFIRKYIKNIFSTNTQNQWHK